jgi:hypothetical protein
VPAAADIAVSDAALVPAVCGENRTLIVHIPPAGRIVLLQLSLAIANCVASDPEIDTTMVPVDEPPVLVAVNVVSGVVIPGGRLPKSFDVGASISAPGATTLPESATVAVPPGLAVIVSVAVPAPVDDGASRTVTVQLSAGTSTWPAQPSRSIRNSTAPGPLSVAAPSWPVSAVLLFVNRKLAGALVLPATTTPKSNIVVSAVSPMSSVPASSSGVNRSIGMLQPMPSTSTTNARHGTAPDPLGRMRPMVLESLCAAQRRINRGRRRRDRPRTRP